MQTANIQSWRISVRARTRRFHFKFRASKFITNEPHFVSSSFTFLPKLTRIFARIKSKTRNLVAKLKSKLRQGEPYRGFHRNLDFPANGSCKSFDQETVASITGNLALLSHCVSKNDTSGITVHAFTLCFYLISLVIEFLTVKGHLPLLLSASLASSTGFSLNYLNYKGLISESVWQTWNQVVSFGCLYIFARIILSRISPNIKRKNLFGLMVACSLVPIFMMQPYDSWVKGKKSKWGKEVREAIPVWIADLLLMWQTISAMIKNPRNLHKLSIFIPSAPIFVKEVARMLAPYQIEEKEGHGK